MVSILEIYLNVSSYIFQANLENGNYARSYFSVPNHNIKNTRKQDQFIIFLLCVFAII